MSRPRAADDFPMIRSRMVELRRERERALARQDARLPIGARPHDREEVEDHRILPRLVRGRFVR